ncbi:MAG: hypothetical protein GY733_02725 [bacterium]|nr:hypothetical protein [bacterium]
MPVLPMIDLLILMGWTSLALGGVLKAIAVTTNYRPDILSLGPLEFLELAAIFLLFALALAARTWVKANEPEILAQRRRVSSLRAPPTPTPRGTADYEFADAPHSDPARTNPALPTTDVPGS